MIHAKCPICTEAITAKEAAADLGPVLDCPRCKMALSIRDGVAVAHPWYHGWSKLALEFARHVEPTVESETSTKRSSFGFYGPKQYHETSHGITSDKLYLAFGLRIEFLGGCTLDFRFDQFDYFPSPHLDDFLKECPALPSDVRKKLERLSIALNSCPDGARGELTPEHGYDYLRWGHKVIEVVKTLLPDGDGQEWEEYFLGFINRFYVEPVWEEAKTEHGRWKAALSRKVRARLKHA